MMQQPARDVVTEAAAPRVAVETNGINVIAEEERKGRPAQLSGPWFASNVSVFGLAYGSFLLGFGISFWQAMIAGIIGIVVSFSLCGLVAIAGKRGSAPTLVSSRAAFGVTGNKVPSILSWVLTVGWETALVSPAKLATAQAVPLVLLAVGTFPGWGLVTNTYADWLSWQGYLLGPLGLGGKDGAWAFANLGVLAAFLLGLLGTLAFRRPAVRAQEAA